MADIRGIQQMNWAGIPGLLQIPEIRPMVVDINRRAKLLDLFRFLGGWDKVSNDKWYTVQSQAGFYTLDTTAAVITGSGTATVTVTGLATGQSGKAIVADLVILPAGTQARIQSVTTTAGQDTIVLRSIAAGNPNLTLVAGNILRQFSNAQEEGSKAPTPRQRGFDTIYNQAHILRKSYAATDIMKARGIKSLWIDVAGKRTEFGVGRIEQYLQHRAEVASALLMSQMSDPNFTNANPTVTGEYGRGVQTTRGLLPTIDTYGSAVNLASAGVWTAADWENVLGKMSDVEGPDEYMLVGSTRAITRASNFFKAIGSSSTMPQRINLNKDDTSINLEVEQVQWGGRQLNLMNIDVLDFPGLFPTAGTEAKSLYALPMGSMPILNGSGDGMSANPWFQVNYLPVNEPGVGNEMEAEVRLGALIQPPNSGDNVDQATWCSIVGLETPKPQAMIKIPNALA